MVDSKTLGIISNFCLGSTILFVVFLAYDVLRYFFPLQYYYREEAAKDPLAADYTGKPLVVLPRPSNRPLSWIIPTLKYPESLTIVTHGLDVTMYLRFLATQVKVFGILSLYSLFVLIPTYSTASNRYLLDEKERPVGIEIMSLSNVPDKSGRLWVTLVSEIVVVAVLCYFLYRDMHRYTEYRRFYRSQNNNPSNFAVIIQDIPRAFRESSKIYDTFDKVFPGQVVDVHLVRDSQTLLSIKNRYSSAVRQLERAEFDVVAEEKEKALAAQQESSLPPESSLDTSQKRQQENRKAKNSKKKRPKVPTLTPKQRLAACRKKKKEALARVVEKEEDLDSIAPLTRAAIVVFRTKRAATFAATAPISKAGGQWVVSRAAEPRGVNWDRLDISGYTVLVRQYATFVCLTGLAIFWTIPSTFIQAMGNLEELSEEFTFLRGFIADYPDVVKVIEGLLPPLSLFVLLLLIPIFMRYVVGFERIHSKIQVEAKIRNFLILFYVMSNFVYVVILGSVLKKLSSILDNPTRIVNLLSNSVPAQATFLMKYVMINAFLGSAIGFLNIARLIIRPLRMSKARTKRELRIANGMYASYAYGKTYAVYTMISLICFVYSTIAPFICVVAFMYYSIAYLCVKQTLLYSHRPHFEGGGVLFRDAWTFILAGLYVHQLSMIGIFGLKLAPIQGTMTLFSLGFTIWFTIYCRGRFLFRAKHGTLTDQIEEDIQTGSEDLMPENFSALYIHPGLHSVHELSEYREVAGVENAKLGVGDISV